MTESFSALWERWVAKYGSRDADLEAELENTYRAAWALGDADDRYAVLYFIFDRRDGVGFDLILAVSEAMKRGLRATPPP